MKKQCNKNLVITKKDVVNFENYSKCHICDNAWADGDVTVKDHCHTTGEYRGSAHRDCNTKVKLNQKIPVIFQNLKYYDLHLIMQQLSKFNFKINAILKKYMSININSKLVFIASFQF